MKQCKPLKHQKENGLKAGLSDESRTACTGIDNRDICGYGSGHGAIPYFEGGVGVTCFFEILEKCGFRCSIHCGKYETFYNIYKMEVKKMKVIRMDCKKRCGYCRIWVDAENIEQAINKTGIKNIVDYCIIEIKEV